ncbi:MAG: hypothetical protein GY747_07625 [Planctomycetes bacterium]|nr:hypothetical protein [Planctomycetota bacterium]MCP4771031.1 hypothetical protein [Planctomycetota bacterium]
MAANRSFIADVAITEGNAMVDGFPDSVAKCANVGSARKPFAAIIATGFQFSITSSWAAWFQK